MMQSGVVHTREKLSQGELDAITHLQDVCNEADGLQMKLNWMRLNARVGDVTNDFLWYADDQLVGFLGLYQFVPDVAELSGMVHPAYRRRGIFRQLFEAARRELTVRRVDRILLICERKSPGAVPFAAAVGGEYRFSEFRMDWSGALPAVTNGSEVALRRVGAEAAGEIARQNHIYFGIPLPAEDDLESMEFGAPGREAYLAVVDGDVVGKVHVHVQAGEGWVAGLGVLPAYRRRGYGRAILRGAVERLAEMSPDIIALEVETQNDSALTLYQSCGFEVVTGYDYYAVSTNE